jgi:hypothetical protein
MMSVDTRELQKLQNTLQAMNRQALPYATRQTVNDLAFAERALDPKD